MCLVMELMDTSLAKLLHGTATERSGAGQLGQVTAGGGSGGGAGRSLLPLDLVRSRAGEARGRWGRLCRCSRTVATNTGGPRVHHVLSVSTGRHGSNDSVATGC